MQQNTDLIASSSINPKWVKKEQSNSITYTTNIFPTVHPTAHDINTVIIKVTPEGSTLPIAYFEGYFIGQQGVKEVLFNRKPMKNVTDCLRAIFNYNFHLRSEFLSHPIRRGSGVWGTELQNVDLAFIDMIWTASGHRRKGIASKMVQIFKRVASKNYGLNFIITCPAYFRAAASWKEDSDNDWRPWKSTGDIIEWETLYETDEICPQNKNFRDGYDAGMDRALMFWRNSGARRIGKSYIFGIALESSHPANHLIETGGDELRSGPLYECTKDEPHDHDICEDEDQKAEDKLGEEIYELSTPGKLQHYLKAHGYANMLKHIKYQYENRPVVHIAVLHREVDVVKWFVEHMGELVFSARDEWGYTPLDALKFKIQRSKNMRAYGEDEINEQHDRDCDELLSLLTMNKLKFAHLQSEGN